MKFTAQQTGAGAYPMFTVAYGNTIPAGTTLSFMAYLDVSSTLETYNRAEAKEENTSYRACNTTDGWLVNNWHEITVTLASDTNVQTIFFNLYKEKVNGVNQTIFGSETVTIYLDNFMLTPATTE